VELPEEAKAMDPDRKAAVALNPYFQLELKLASGNEVMVKKGEALPVERFVLKAIQILNESLPPNFAEERFLPALAEVRSLESIAGAYWRLILTEQQTIQLTRLPLAGALKDLWVNFELTTKVVDALRRLPSLTTLYCNATKADDASLLRLSE